MWHILQMSLSFLVTCTHDGCMVCSVPSFVVQAVSYCMTSGPVTIHLLSAAGSPVTPNAPTSILTTAFLSLVNNIIGESFRLDLCTITFQLRTPEPSEVVSGKSYCLCRGQEYNVHNLHCFWQHQLPELEPGTLKFVTLTLRFDRESFLSVFNLAAVVRIGFTMSYILVLGTSAGL